MLMVIVKSVKWYLLSSLIIIEKVKGWLLWKEPTFFILIGNIEKNF